MNMKKLLVVGAGLALAGCCSTGPCKCCCEKNPLSGDWGLKLPYDSMYAGHILFTRDTYGKTQAFTLLRWGSPEWCDSVHVDGTKFSFYHPYGSWVEGEVDGDKMTGLIFGNKDGKKDGKGEPFTGWKNPKIACGATSKGVKLGEPIDLLKDGLAGWKTMDEKAKFGWSFKDGVLSNKLGLKPDGTWAGGGANLMSKRADFYDFNLEYDVRVPKGSNSGVYLRGRYECQVIDSYQLPVNRHNMAAYYGRVAPKKTVDKAPGEWQHVNVTLANRHLTVYLNGELIIDDVPVVGVTGGAIDANEFVPGPMYIQGDHSDADFKNMILRPVVK